MQAKKKIKTTDYLKTSPNYRLVVRHVVAAVGDEHRVLIKCLQCNISNLVHMLQLTTSGLPHHLQCKL